MGTKFAAPRGDGRVRPTRRGAANSVRQELRSCRTQFFLHLPSTSLITHRNMREGKRTSHLLEGRKWFRES